VRVSVNTELTAAVTVTVSDHALDAPPRPEMLVVSAMAYVAAPKIRIVTTSKTRTRLRATTFSSGWGSAMS
jgi:hypothetical protein